MSRDESAPPRGPREMFRLGNAALRLIWVADRRDFIVVVLMDILPAFGVLVIILQVQKMLAGLISVNAGTSAPQLTLPIVVFVIANMINVIAQAVIFNRRMMLAERTGMYACG